MATFPSLVPSGRTFTPGDYPHTPFNTISGFQNRVRHSNVMLSSQVRLTFVALTEANMLSILNHYQGQLGTYESFDLPAAVWSGATAADYQLTSYLWRYTAPPTVEDVYYGRYNIELALETVPPDGAIIDGMYRIVFANVLGGEVLTTNGLSGSILIGFSAAGFQLPGLDNTVTTSLSAANGIVATVTLTITTEFPGADFSVSATFIGGTATAASSSDYWADMSAQLYGWESLAYIEWWGN